MSNNEEHIAPIIVEAYSYKHKFSPHFTYGEMIKSATGVRLGISNEPNPIQFKNLKNLCIHVLEPVRVNLGVVLVGSGLRVDRVNREVGGSKRSQHRYGEAADFDVVGYNTTEVFEWIILESNIIWDQIIHEFGNGGWIHGSYTTRRTNRQKITVAMKVWNEDEGKMKTNYTDYTKKDIINGNYKHA